jgi:drug/metabolite transporter (DMT)-like permease
LTGFLLAFGASLGWGVADFLGGRASRHASALLVLALSQAIGAGIAVAAAIAVGLGEPNGFDLLYAAGAGVALTLGLGALYRAMAVGAMAVASPVAATGTVIPVAVGLAGGDRPSPLQAVGVGAAVIGVMLCARERRPAGLTGKRLARGVGLALLAALGGGLTATALAAASSAGVLWVLVIQRATVTAIALAVALRGGIPRLDRDMLPAVVAIGVLDLAATGAFTLAATHAELSLVAVVGALYPVVTVALAYLVLSERMAAHQALGAFVALAGTAAIAGG